MWEFYDQFKGLTRFSKTGGEASICSLILTILMAKSELGTSNSETVSVYLAVCKHSTSDKDTWDLHGYDWKKVGLLGKDYWLYRIISKLYRSQKSYEANYIPGTAATSWSLFNVTVLPCNKNTNIISVKKHWNWKLSPDYKLVQLVLRYIAVTALSRYLKIY